MQCPTCRSDKHTSLPFGYTTRSKRSARTYRCLVCDALFVRRARKTPKSHSLEERLGAA